MKNGRFRWRNFVVAATFSLVFHVTYLVPQVLRPLTEKPDRPVEITYAPEIDLPDEPSPEPPAPEEAAPAPKPEAKPPAPEVAQVEPPKPEQPKPEPPQPEPQVQPPKPPPPMQRMQMVDQDKFPDEADNDEARYLAQKNHRVKEDTRGENTNLVREVESKNDHTSQPNENADEKPGAKDDKIAELEDRAGPDKTLPRSAPKQGDEGDRLWSVRKPGKLAMRDLTPRSQVTPDPLDKTREGVELSERERGELPLPRIGRDAERGRAGAQKGGKVKLSLDHHDYDAIEGYDTAEKERQAAARAESSHRKGRYDRYLAKLGAMRQSIENFVPNVKPGNQTELGTRAHPFAGYITAMHRQIHKFFAFGFLADLDMRSGKSPYDDMTLWSKLEIVVNGDGTLHKVGLVRSSGVTGFDVAAIDSVMSAAPFPTPPKDIRSADGKVYLHWQFHRDESACITTGVDPFILTTPGETPKDSGWNLSELKGGREAPRTLKREPEVREHAPASKPSSELPVPEVTPEVRAAAEGWFAAYVRGDAAWLAGWSATPFVAAGEIVAEDAAKLKAMYRQLLAEAPQSRRLERFEVLTPAGIRGRLGGLPPGGEDTGMLFAVGKVASEEFILLLKKSNRGWRVAGLAR